MDPLGKISIFANLITHFGFEKKDVRVFSIEFIKLLARHLFTVLCEVSL